MRSEESKLLDILGKQNVQFVVPIFQRVYSWTKNQCDLLFDDVMRAGKTGQDHFVGVFLYTPEDDSSEGYTRCQIVDGQQRMTTLTLMLVALIQKLRNSGAKVKDPSSGKEMDSAQLAKRYLFAGERGNSLKMLLTLADRDMLEYVIGAGEKPEDISSQLQANLELFEKRMAGSTFDADQFWNGLNRLTVIEIELGKEDSPQRVFESTNSKGKRLNLEDVLRNDIIMEANARDDRDLEVYMNLWEPLEDAFEEVDDVTIDDMICCWLASLYSYNHVKSEDDLLVFLRTAFDGQCGGSYKSLTQNLYSYGKTFLDNDEMRRSAMKRMEKWRSGIPQGSISQYKLFGD